MNYYNENDRKAAAWLRELIEEGVIPPGFVDERSILDVRPYELTGYTQHHFFAGICGWSLALQLAGWPADRPVRTGSCPCQPFSIAGKGKGTQDERHLWPAFRDILTFLPPAITFGEQVASPAGREWLSGVRADLEGVGYAVGAADLCAAGVGSPHIRQRLYWVADPNLVDDDRTGHGSSTERRERDGEKGLCGQHPVLGMGNTDGGHAGPEWKQRCGEQRFIQEDSGPGRMADTPGMSGPQQLDEPRSGTRRGPSPVDAAKCAGSCGMGNTDEQGFKRESLKLLGQGDQGNFWSRYDLLPCTDGKSRRIESGTFPLVARVPGGVVPSGDPSATEAQASGENRSARLKGYGNSIVPELAAVFIIASTEQYRTI